MKTVITKPVLYRPTGLCYVLEQDDPIILGSTYPIEFSFPILYRIDQTCHRVLRQWLSDRNANLMPLRDQSHIQRAEIARVANSEKTHLATKSQTKFAPITLKTPG